MFPEVIAFIPRKLSRSGVDRSIVSPLVAIFLMKVNIISGLCKCSITSEQIINFGEGNANNVDKRVSFN